MKVFPVELPAMPNDSPFHILHLLNFFTCVLHFILAGQETER